MAQDRLRSPARALGTVLILTLAPLGLWHQVPSDELASFHWSLAYAAAELGPWLLLLAGVGFLVPVALSAGSHPESRLYPRGRRSYFVWGVVLYLLGAVLAFQVFDVWSYAH
jgi:hypothetical protein